MSGRAQRALVLSSLAAGLLGVGAIVVAARVRQAGNPDALIAQAKQAIQAGQWVRAGSLLDRLAALRKPTAADALLRAEAKNGGGRTDEAVAILTGVPAADPLAAQARLRAGQVERERHRLRDAEVAFLDAIRLDPHLIQARRELIFLYGMQARRAELSEQFRALAGFVELTFDDLFFWTTSHQDVWINTAIQPDLERYLAADPADRWSRLALAQVLLKSGQLDEAERVLRPLPSSDAEAMAVRAQIALDRSRRDEAQAILEAAPAEHPALALVRGQCAMRQNDWPTAVTQLRIAVRLEPCSQEAVRSLALALRQTGNTSEETAFLEQAGRLRTLTGLIERARETAARKDRTLPRRLAAACEAVGLRDLALGWYRLAIRYDVLDSEAQRGVFRLTRPAHGT